MVDIKRIYLEKSMADIDFSMSKWDLMWYHGHTLDELIEKINGGLNINTLDYNLKMLVMSRSYIRSTGLTRGRVIPLKRRKRGNKVPKNFKKERTKK
jgi:hypothetical protein